MATKIREEKYVKTDQSAGKNNNKFWVAEVYDDGTFTSLYGRIGDPGKRTKPKSFGSVSAANDYADKKIREKLRARNNEIPYRKLDVVSAGTTSTVKTSKAPKGDLESIAQRQIRYNNPNVASLVSYLTKVNAHDVHSQTGGQITYNDTTGLFQTELGVVSQGTIDEANDILVKIGDMVAKQQYTNRPITLTGDYLMLIPQNTGRRRLEMSAFWDHLDKVKAQKQILDSLQSSLVTATTNPTTKTTKVPEKSIFDVQLDLVEKGSTIDRIKKLYRGSRKTMHSCHHLDVKTVYSVDINTVRQAFERDGAKMDNIWELWHGSASSNLLSILKGGLIIPKSTSSHVTGRLYGDGIYASDISTKALGYAYGYWSGRRDDNCFMFLLDMAMGDYYLPKRSNYTSTRYPASGYDSTFAKEGTGIMNNEMITYKTSRVNLKYLVEFSPNGK